MTKPKAKGPPMVTLTVHLHNGRRIFLEEPKASAGHRKDTILQYGITEVRDHEALAHYPASAIEVILERPLP